MAATPQRTRRRQHPEETRAQILLAAERFLSTRPFRELSVDELMRATGHSRTVFYRHFDDLPDLVLHLLQAVGGELYETGERWARAVERSTPAVEEGLGAIVDFFAAHGRVMAAIVEASHHDEEIERVYHGFLDVFVELTARALEGVRQAGRAREPLDAREVAKALTLLNERYLLETFGRAADPPDRERPLHALVTIWERTIYGLAPGSR